MNIDKIIADKLDIKNDIDVSIYNNLETRFESFQKISEIVNDYIPQIESFHDKKNELELKEKGYTVIDDFFTTEEVDKILEIIKVSDGYNYHIAINAFNQEVRNIANMGDWNIMSFMPDVFIKSPLLLNKFIDKRCVSLAQSYFGCFPTLYSVNCTVSKFVGKEFKTQTVHRDFDDFKFLSFFVYLSDIDTNNGPHMYFPGTQNGNSQSGEPVEICGKKGTVVVADVYGLHYGKPLVEKDRIILWFRFGLSLNKMYYKNQDFKFSQDASVILSHIPNTLHNKYLLRGFINNVSI